MKKIEQKTNKIDEEALIEQRRRERELIMAKYKNVTSAAPAAEGSGQQSPAVASPAGALPLPKAAPLVIPKAFAPPAFSKPPSPLHSGRPSRIQTPTSAHPHMAESTGGRSPEILAADYDDENVKADADHKAEKVNVAWAAESDSSDDEDGQGARAKKSGTRRPGAPAAATFAPVAHPISVPPSTSVVSRASPERELAVTEEDVEAMGMEEEEMRSSPPTHSQNKPAKAAPAVSTVDDMFAPAEADDMFAQFDASKKLVAIKPMISVSAPAPATLASDHADNWDDAEGYYSMNSFPFLSFPFLSFPFFEMLLTNSFSIELRIGELLGGRYKITTHLGKGVFSTVVKALDTKNSNGEVAIKVIRSNDTMYKAGQKEMKILKKLNDSDPQDRRHVVRMLDSFEHRGHLCLVFESLSLNLRDLIKQFGKNVGINIRGVRLYAIHLFLALDLLARNDILHADLKPDNILVNDKHNVAKLADLGSASMTNENEITPYLVTRFYRSPEISKDFLFPPFTSISMFSPPPHLLIASPGTSVRDSNGRVGRWVHALRALHRTNPLPWPLQQPHAQALHGRAGQGLAQDDPEGGVLRTAL